MRATLIAPPKPEVPDNITNIELVVNCSKPPVDVESVCPSEVDESLLSFTYPVEEAEFGFYMFAPAYRADQQVTVDWGDGTITQHILPSYEEIFSVLWYAYRDGVIEEEYYELLADFLRRAQIRHRYAGASVDHTIKISSVYDIEHFSLRLTDYNTDSGHQLEYQPLDCFSSYWRLVAVNRMESTCISMLNYAFSGQYDITVLATFNADQMPMLSNINGIFSGYNNTDNTGNTWGWFLPEDAFSNTPELMSARWAFDLWSAFDDDVPEGFLSNTPNLIDISGICEHWASFNGSISPAFLSTANKVRYAYSAFSNWFRFDSAFHFPLLTGGNTELITADYMYAAWTNYNQPLPEGFLAGDYSRLDTIDRIMLGWTKYNQPLPEGMFAGEFTLLRNMSKAFGGWYAFNNMITDGFLAVIPKYIQHMQEAFGEWKTYNKPLPTQFLTGDALHLETASGLFVEWTNFNSTMPTDMLSGELSNCYEIDNMFSNWKIFNQPLTPTLLSGEIGSKAAGGALSIMRICYHWELFNQPLPSGFLQHAAAYIYIMDSAFSDWYSFNQDIVNSFFSSDFKKCRRSSYTCNQWNSFNSSLGEGFLETLSWPSTGTQGKDWRYMFAGWSAYTGQRMGPSPQGEVYVQLANMYNGNSLMTGEVTSFIQDYTGTASAFRVGGCFKDCTSLSDYATIPAVWK